MNWPHFLAELLSSHISVPQPVPNPHPNLGLPQLVLLSILEVESQTSCSEFILTKQIFAQGLAFPAGLFSARECSSHGLCQFKTRQLHSYLRRFEAWRLGFLSHCEEQGVCLPADGTTMTCEEIEAPQAFWRMPDFSVMSV